MRKLLHERLRNHNPIDEDGCIFRIDKITSMELSGLDASHLADEIERYYIPRPRFDDGEPVQFSSETDKLKRIEAILFKSDGGFELQGKHVAGYGTTVIIHDQNELVKRPQPKVLDADGVEIKVGDKVYEVETGYESTVTSTTMMDSDGNTVCCKDGCPGELHYKPSNLTHKKPVLDADGVPIKVGDTVYSLDGAYGDNPLEVIGVIDSDYVRLATTDAEGWTSYLGKRVSHKEPDSLERIAESMIRYRNQAIADDMPEYDAITKWADRLTALMERDA